MKKLNELKYVVMDENMEGTAAWKAKQEREYMAKVKSGEIKLATKPFAREYANRME